MNRLTNCSEITAETDMKCQCGYSHIYKRLAEYEDTGLTPQEISDIKKKMIDLFLGNSKNYETIESLKDSTCKESQLLEELATLKKREKICIIESPI